MVLLSLAFLVTVNSALSLSLDTNNSTKAKRQIFREQVNPQAGGRIPEDAFRSDRLALNRLNKEGIAVPDGVVLEARHRESHYGSHRHDPDIQASIVKVVLGEDGRYAPPEGRYPFNSLVESTYVLRPSINTPVIAVPPQRPHLTTLRLPARPFFQQDSVFNSLDHQLDYFNSFDPNLSPSGLWTGLLGPVPDVPNRLLRRQAKIPADDVLAQNSNFDSKVTGSRGSNVQHGKLAGTLSPSPVDHTVDQSFRSVHQARSYNVFQHPSQVSSSQNSHRSNNRFTNPREQSERNSDEYENRLVPVYLTPHKENNYEPPKTGNYIPYVSQDSNYSPVIPIINFPLSGNPNYQYQEVDPNNGLPVEKIVESRPHYVVDSPQKEIYIPQTDKTLIPLPQYTYIKSDAENQFQNTVQKPQVSTALFDYGQPDDGYKEVLLPNYQTHAHLKEHIPNSNDSPNQPSSQQQLNILQPVHLSHNQQIPQVYNHFKQNPFQQSPTNLKQTPEKQDVQYQLINSYSNLDIDYHNQKSSQSHKYNQLVKLDKGSNNNDRNNKDALSHQNVKQVPDKPYNNLENYQKPGTNNEGIVRRPIDRDHRPHQDAGRWPQSLGNSLKIISNGQDGQDQGNRGIQYVRGGLQFEVINNQPGIRQQSRGEVGQKSLSLHSRAREDSAGSKPAEVGSKHLDQVLHYIEPHEVVHQISTAPSIEHEYPSLDTVPETSFTCQGAARAMLPDPQTSCQVFHLCNGDGSKESFLCPKGSRYDSLKQQCSPWTQVSCHP